MLTTKEFIEKLQRLDPLGEKLIMFRVYNEDDDEQEIVGYGELDHSASFCIKDNYQMQGKDENIIRIDLPMDFS